jgi:hypothetical protein
MKPAQNQRNTQARIFTHRERGTFIAELAVSAIFAVPLILSVMDLGVIAMGAQLNDAVSRESARAAASGPPAGTTAETNRVLGNMDQPYRRAAEVIDKINTSGIPAKVRDVIAATESLVDVPPTSQGGAIDGQVSVETTVDIYPPFILGEVLAGGKVSLAARHTVPFTYVVPRT